MSEKNMREVQGKTTIDPGVLVEISKLAALSVPGVSGLVPNTQTAGSIFSKSVSNGVKIEVENNTVYVDLYLRLSNNSDLHQTSQAVQDKVSRSIVEMVGMDVGKINIHIEDITFEKNKINK